MTAFMMARAPAHARLAAKAGVKVRASLIFTAWMLAPPNGHRGIVQFCLRASAAAR